MARAVGARWGVVATVGLAAATLVTGASLLPLGADLPRRAAVVAVPQRPPASGTVLVAIARSAVRVYPFAQATVPTRTLPARLEDGTPASFLVERSKAGRRLVLLPLGANGASGWVRDDDVRFTSVDVAVDVDLTSRRLTLRRAGRLVLDVPVAVGAPRTPTPTGRFFVTDLLAINGLGNAYGPFAFGVSAHSPVLRRFADGDAQIGLHGTNDPASLGQQVSHGCVRVDNATIRRLAAELPLGTPVVIRA